MGQCTCVCDRAAHRFVELGIVGRNESPQRVRVDLFPQVQAPQESKAGGLELAVEHCGRIGQIRRLVRERAECTEHVGRIRVLDRQLRQLGELIFDADNPFSPRPLLLE